MYMYELMGIFQQLTVPDTTIQTEVNFKKIYSSWKVRIKSLQLVWQNG